MKCKRCKKTKTVVLVINGSGDRIRDGASQGWCLTGLVMGMVVLVMDGNSVGDDG